MKSRLLCALLLLLTAFLAPAEPAPLGRTQTLKDQFLPGPELQPKPGDSRDPVVLRITAVYPHGTAGFRYDFTWSALEPGSYDLTKFLEPANGAAPVPLPPIAVEAASTLPPGPPGALPEPQSAALASIGGYRIWLPVGIILWAIGGFSIFFFMRKRRAPPPLPAGPSAQTLAQRLQPLLHRAIGGGMSTSEKAELERLVIAYGRERLGVSDDTATPAVWQSLREDPATSSWLRTLEDWLHRPSPAPPDEAELKALLSRITATPSAPA